MTRHVFALAIALLIHGTTPTATHGTPPTVSHEKTPINTERPPKTGFELTVDSIMRGPDLVGYPPTGLRWSADSQKLFFEWRKPGEEEASTYVVNRGGGTPTKLTDEQRKSAPPVNGRRARAYKRVVFADRGELAMS